MKKGDRVLVPGRGAGTVTYVGFLDVDVRLDSGVELRGLRGPFAVPQKDEKQGYPVPAGWSRVRA